VLVVSQPDTMVRALNMRRQLVSPLSLFKCFQAISAMDPIKSENRNRATRERRNQRWLVILQTRSTRDFDGPGADQLGDHGPPSRSVLGHASSHFAPSLSRRPPSASTALASRPIQGDTAWSGPRRPPGGR
jgi:hypothetical protein